MPSDTHDDLAPRGELLIELWGPDGDLKDTRRVKNLVTTAGKGLIANRLQAAPTIAAIGWMALGTGSTAVSVGDTALQTEIAASRTVLTSSIATANAITMICTFNPGVGTGAVTEAGTFNAATGGTMLGHTLFGTITKAPGDTMTITWTTTFP